MKNTVGSIGTIAESVLSEVKQRALTKLAEHKIVKEASERPVGLTPLTQTLLKLAGELRTAANDVTIGDLEQFIAEVK